MQILGLAATELFTPYYIVGQVFAVIGYALHFVCYCLPKKTQIVILECVSKAMNIVSFFFLQSLAGVLANAVIILRGITVYFRETRHKKLVWAYAVIMVMLVGCGIYSYETPWSICAFVPMLISTTTTWFLGTQGIRLGQILASVVYLAFQISIPNIAGIVLECVVIVICLVTFLVYNKNAKNKSAAMTEGDGTQVATTTEE